MARSLSHLTGHELAALAAPFENPSYARAKGRNLGLVDNRQKHSNLKLLSTEVALSSDILGKLEGMETNDDDLIDEYARAHSAGRRALSQAEKRPEQVYPAAGYLKHLRGLLSERFPALAG